MTNSLLQHYKLWYHSLHSHSIIIHNSIADIQWRVESYVATCRYVAQTPELHVASYVHVYSTDSTHWMFVPAAARYVPVWSKQRDWTCHQEERRGDEGRQRVREVKKSRESYSGYLLALFQVYSFEVLQLPQVPQFDHRVAGRSGQVVAGKPWQKEREREDRLPMRHFKLQHEH